MTRIFISYRRDDSAFQTSAIHTQLVAAFGSKNVFMDVDNIPAGQDFRVHLQSAIQQCDVCVAVIGDRWLTASSDAEVRRLENEADFVRIEIEAALQRGIPVIPLLVGNQLMPTAEELPPSMAELSFRQALRVRAGRDFRNDMKDLLEQLRSVPVRTKDGPLSEKRNPTPAESRPRAATPPRSQGAQPSTGRRRAVSTPAAQAKKPAPARQRTATPAADRTTQVVVRKKPGWGIPLVAGLLLVAALLGFMKMRKGEVLGGSKKAGGYVPPSRLVAGPLEVAVDPESGSRYPDGWEIVDATAGAEGWAEQVREPVTGMVLQLIPPGEFLMGSPEDEPGRGEDETQHSVQLTRPFYMGVTEVTEAQVQRLRGESGGSDLPITSSTWQAARTFCKNVGCDLPTEAQWEYAARAGTTTPWWWGSEAEEGEGNANVSDYSAAIQFRHEPEFAFNDGHAGPAPVALFGPNVFGLHDMIGNVWEWCLDEYGGDYGPSSAVDPRVEYDGRTRVVRGGSFATPIHQTRSACRLTSDGTAILQPGIPFGQTGFRVALTIP